MCTLIAFHRVWADAPLVVATNRDEALDRPSGPPRWWGGEPDVLAPLDERAGGTWMGASRRGLWVGLTNRRAGRNDPGLRSRGLLCRDLLRTASVAEAVSRLESLGDRYNPFHVVTADADRMVLVEYESGRADVRALGSGCHVVTNRPFDEQAEEPKARRAWRLLYDFGLWPAERDLPAPADLEARLAAILGDHGSEGADALCLHGERYGTRSAAIWGIAWPAGGSGEPHIRLAFADGPPCTTPFACMEGGALTGRMCRGNLPAGRDPASRATKIPMEDG
ncbi:MAG TPA: NRDE family protein [Gemmatimonadota bacterium]|nr:NRDE family protein [Gemmatimonadota bacterium]